MATRKLFRFAAAAALLALITACGGGGGSGSTADPAPPVTAQSAVTLSLSISEQDRTVLVSTITTTDSKNAVAPVTEANAVTIDKVAYNVAGGLVKDSAGGNLLLPLDVKTAVSATVHTGGQVLSKTVELMATCADGLVLVVPTSKCMVPATAWLSSTVVLADVSTLAATASWRELVMSDDGINVIRLVLPQGTHNCGFDGVVGSRRGLMVSCDGLTGYTPATFQVWPSSDRKALLATKVSDTDLRETASYLAVSLSHKLEWALCMAEGVATGRAVPGTTPQVCNRDKEVAWTGGGTVATPGLQALIAPATLK